MSSPVPARRISPLSQLVAVAGLLLTAACGGGDGSGTSATAASSSSSGSSSASTAEGGTDLTGTKGTLTIYSGRNQELVEPVLRNFNKATGIGVEARYGESAELAAQLIEEGDQPAADVFFSQDAGALGALSQEDRLTKLPAEQLERVSPRFRSDEGTWVGVSGRARVIVYAPGKISGPVPTSIYDLTESAYSGQVGYAPTNASFQAFVTGLRVSAGEEKAREWLEAFKDNKPKTYANNIAVLDAVNDGQISAGLINHYYWYEKVAELGADKVTAKLSYPKDGDPGALVNVAGAGVLEGAAEPDLAQQFVDYLLKPEAQRYFANTTYEYPLVQGVGPAAGLPPLSGISGPDIDLSELSSLAETLELLNEVGLT
ncbi:MAG: iron ABC transporter substrate-binding protein [Actinomycetota bacterium]|nr:iron ABC transporter substrate-binding protein [Actinomycetota bacterium]